jgi:hypothetical protein
MKKGKQSTNRRQTRLRMKRESTSLLNGKGYSDYRQRFVYKGPDGQGHTLGDQRVAYCDKRGGSA